MQRCTHLYEVSMSFDTLHTITKRAPPPQMMKYKLALQSHDLYSNVTMSNEWLSIFFNQNFNARSNKANFIDNSKYKIGKNLISNRLTIINNSIKFDWLNFQAQVQNPVFTLT